MFRKSEWLDCSRADIAGQLFLPMQVGPVMRGRSTSVVSLLHDHPIVRRPAGPMAFILRIRDQRGRLHRAKLRLVPHHSVVRATA
jgi:hypothetical protein